METTLNTLSTWWNEPATQSWLIEKPLHILLTIIVASFAHWLLRRLIDRLARHNATTPISLPKLAGTLTRRSREADDSSAQAEAMRQTQEARRVTRIRTLADVGKSAAAILVWSWAILAILSTLGVNVAPIIASAGVVGVALGFGAQSLVKDFLSGIFMLLEDQYGVGDTVDVGNGITGEVEEVTLRVTTLRDIDGTLWYVRNGEILRVGNFSDEYSIARIQVPIGLSNDTDKAAEVILESAKKAVADPAISNFVLGEPTFNGITDVAPDHLSLRLSVKTLPAKQWTVQRRLLSQALADMQAAGITTPYPHGVGGFKVEP